MPSSDTRRESLLYLWDKSENPDNRTLLVAAIVMMGATQPSPIAAWSLAQNIENTTTWEGLLCLGIAYADLTKSGEAAVIYSDMIAGSSIAIGEKIVKMFSNQAQIKI